MRVDLSIDFDFFVREDPMWDWGHSEDGDAGAFMAGPLWTHRYMDLDLWKETDPKTFADFAPEHLLGRLMRRGLVFTENVKRRLMIADSHKHAYDFFRKTKSDVLVNIDAHHDCWTLTNGQKVGCDTWLTALRFDRRDRQYTQVYPKWKDPGHDGLPQPYIGHPARKPASVEITTWDKWRGIPGGVVGDIFVCRSPVWVPPHHDDAFKLLVEGQLAPVCGDIEVPVPMPVRTAPTPEDAAKGRAQLRELIEKSLPKKD